MTRAAFDPYFPTTDLDTQRFAEDITGQLNRVHRNEWTFAMPCEDAIYVPVLTTNDVLNNKAPFRGAPFYGSEVPSSGNDHAAVTLRCGWGPYIAGYFLKRVRLVKATAQSRTTSGGSIQVRALVSDSRGADVVGTYDSRTQGLAANEDRVISTSASLNRSIAARSVVQVETTQLAWPKISARDITVLFDIGIS